MRRLFPAAGLAIAALIVGGCAVPSGPAGLPPVSAGREAGPALPNAKAGALLYVSDTETSNVYVYTYPGGVLKQTLGGFIDPGGECVDAKGNVFVTNTGGLDIVEYAHGASTPAATLNDPGYFPFGCSVDPTTGNLAVTNFSTASGSGSGNVVIYEHAKGKPKKRYTDAAISGMLLCGYDDKGNLFVQRLDAGEHDRFRRAAQGRQEARRHRARPKYRRRGRRAVGRQVRCRGRRGIRHDLPLLDQREEGDDRGHRGFERRERGRAVLD